MQSSGMFCLENDWKRIRNDFLTIFQNISNFEKRTKPAMLETLFTKLYEKLITEEKNNSNSVSGSFRFFVEEILEVNYGKPSYISPRTLIEYYKKFVDRIENNAGEPKSELKNIIAQYLGSKDYLDFEKSYQEKEIIVTNKVEKEKKDINKPVQKKTNSKTYFRNITISTFALLILPLLYFINIYNNSETETCIIWNENHFENSNCDIKNSLNNALYNINIEKFKQVDVTSETQFFIKGKSIIWYGKSSAGKIDFFTARGIHPKTLEELKPTTEYIINKYVFIDKKDKTIIR